MAQENPQILVVGAGAVGLVLAIQLGRFGVPVRIIDRADAPSCETKAMAIHSRTLEVFRDLGVVQPFLEHGVKTRRFAVHYRGRPILTYEFDRLNTLYPFLLSLPQPDTERFLTARLRDLGVEVERGVELLKLEQSDRGVHVFLRQSSGAKCTETYAWIVGCDGGRSAARRELGIAFEGASYHRYFMLADVDIHWGACTRRLCGRQWRLLSGPPRRLCGLRGSGRHRSRPCALSRVDAAATHRDRRRMRPRLCNGDALAGGDPSVTSERTARLYALSGNSPEELARSVRAAQRSAKLGAALPAALGGRMRLAIVAATGPELVARLSAADALLHGRAESG